MRDVFESVIIPRAIGTALRPSRYLVRFLWKLWPRLAYWFYRDPDKREDFLGMFAPFDFVVLLVLWVALLIFGWGLVFYGIHESLRPPGLTLADALYYAGSSMLTLGYGDIVATSTLSRFISLAAAASGLGVVAIVTSFLFSIFGAFQARERFVVTVGARAGVPPSGVGMLEVHAYAALREDAANVFREGQGWAASVMETHLAYPILMYFRSSHDYQSWVGTLGTLMDAAVLLMTSINPADMRNTQSLGQARIMYEVGRHLAHDFADYFAFMSGIPQGPGIERPEFDEAHARLSRAGYDMLDRDSAWIAFSEMRSTYGPHLNALARWLEIPPLQWVGDRSLIAR